MPIIQLVELKLYKKLSMNLNERYCKIKEKNQIKYQTISTIWKIPYEFKIDKVGGVGRGGKEGVITPMFLDHSVRSSCFFLIVESLLLWKRQTATPLFPSISFFKNQAISNIITALLFQFVRMYVCTDWTSKCEKKMNYI